MYQLNAAAACIYTTAVRFKIGDNMKKVLIATTALLLCACGGGVNKKTVSYQASLFDAAQYYVVAGEGADKQAASQRALSNMQREIAAHTSAVAGANVVPDLMANATVEKAWRASKNEGKHYYALAVLPREKANSVLTPLLNQADGQLAALSQQFTTPSDPLADLKVAYKMQPIIDRRIALDDTYQFINQNASYNAQAFMPYKDLVKQKLAAVRVGVDVDGNESDTLVTYVVEALTNMGLGVVEASDPNKSLLVKVQTEVDGYYSKKVEGLIWVTSNAYISLIDTQKDATFARFNVSERAGTTRQADSIRRSMQAAGEKAAQEIASRLEAYLKSK